MVEVKDNGATGGKREHLGKNSGMEKFPKGSLHSLQIFISKTVSTAVTQTFLYL